MYFGHSITCISNLILHIVDWGCCLVHARRPLDDFLLFSLDSPFSYLFSRLCSFSCPYDPFARLTSRFFLSLFSIRSFRSTHFTFRSSLVYTCPLSVSRVFPGATIPAVLSYSHLTVLFLLVCVCLLGKASQGKAMSIKARHCQANQGNAGQAREGNARLSKGSQGRARSDQAKQNKAWQGKANPGQTTLAI